MGGTGSLGTIAHFETLDVLPVVAIADAGKIISAMRALAKEADDQELPLPILMEATRKRNIEPPFLALAMVCLRGNNVGNHPQVAGWHTVLIPPHP